MLFNSITYLIFLPLVFALYWLLHKSVTKQNILLLGASYVFYAWWDWRFLGLIIFSSLVDYFVGLKLNEVNSAKGKKQWLILSLLTNLGLLGVFKYYNFFASSFSEIIETFGWKTNDLTLQIILPVGISFYTFQTLSYTIDVYRGHLKPTRNVVAFFTYIAFFPQLVAGPIERASNLLPQIEKERTFKKEMFNAGLVQIVVGLFRKIVIADALAVYVDHVYAQPELHNATTLVLATSMYAFQIYYDFAGYSDMAIGSAKLFGIQFRQNFNFPYYSTSLTSFWRKWHMSLSYWLRDYLYISLGGNRLGSLVTYRNLMLTMLLGGLWHGASWNFVIWGGIHGMVLSIEKVVKQYVGLPNSKLLKVFGGMVTFVIVLVGWVFFRTQDVSSATFIIAHLFTYDYSSPFITSNAALFYSSLLMLGLGILFDAWLKTRNIALEELGGRMSFFQMVTFLTLLVMGVSLFYSSSTNFIYFKF